MRTWMIAPFFLFLIAAAADAKTLHLVGQVSDQVRISRVTTKNNQLHFSLQSNLTDGITVEIKDRQKSAALVSRSISSVNPRRIAEFKIPELRPGTYVVTLRRL